MRATLKNFVSGIFLKNNKKNVSNTKTIYFRFENTFVSHTFLNKNTFVLKNIIFV